MPKVDKRMQLINDNRLMKSVYLGRIIQEENGEEIDGRFVWDEYKQLIEETEMEYSERKVKLHNVRSKSECIHLSVQLQGRIYGG